MASNQTANYGLSQWEATDKVERLDFNADNAKLDAALHNMAETHNADMATLREEQLWNKLTDVCLTSAAAQISLNLGDTTGYQALLLHYSLSGPKAVTMVFNGGAEHAVFTRDTASTLVLGKINLISGGANGGVLACYEYIVKDSSSLTNQGRWLEVDNGFNGATTITFASADNNFAKKSSVVVYGLK